MQNLFNWQRRLLAVVLAGMLMLTTAACGSTGQTSVGNSDMAAPEQTKQATPQPSDKQSQKMSAGEKSGSTPSLNRMNPQIDKSAVKDSTPIQQAEDAIRNNNASASAQPPVAKAAEEQLENAGQSAKQATKNAQRAAKNAGQEAKQSAQTAGKELKESAQDVQKSAQKAGRQVKQSAQAAGEEVKESAKDVQESAQKAGRQVKQSAQQAKERAEDAGDRLFD